MGYLWVCGFDLCGFVVCELRLICAGERLFLWLGFVHGC